MELDWPQKTLAATVLLLCLKVTPPIHLAHAQDVWGKKKNELLKGTVVHTPLDEGSNFPGEGFSPTSTRGRLRAGEI